MPEAIASTVPDVLARLRETIAGSGSVGYTSAQVQISLEREPHPTAGGDSFCHLAPKGFRPRGWADGGGRHVEVLDGTIVVRCYARRITDPALVDAIALTGTDSTLPGLLRQAQAVIDLIDVRFVEAANGDLLTCEPVRLKNHGEPVRYRAGREWIWAELAFDAAILLDLAITSEDG